jgi:hypothetical protein
MPTQPAFLIHTGDISHLSKEEEWDIADQVIKSANKQVFYIPGEHDVADADNGKAYLERYGKDTKVARGSRFGGRWKPIWLSLICTKVKFALRHSAAAAPPTRPSVRGTPPLRVQTTPVPAQVMHFNRPRRFMLAAPNRSLWSRSAICLA